MKALLLAALLALAACAPRSEPPPQPVRYGYGHGYPYRGYQAPYTDRPMFGRWGY
jgi:hypothetical protein